MRSIFTALILIVCFNINAQTENLRSIIISNSKTDIINTEQNKVVTCYLSETQNLNILDFKNKLNSISGIKVLNLKKIQSQNHILYSKIQISNDYQKDKLLEFLHEFSFSQIIIDGKILSIDDFLNKPKRNNGIIIK
jgi:hypothetical protein